MVATGTAATKLAEYYSSYLPSTSIRSVLDVPAGHAMVTDTWGTACGVTGKPYINNCG